MSGLCISTKTSTLVGIALIFAYTYKIRNEVTQRSLVAKRQLELKDMIIEDEVPDIG